MARVKAGRRLDHIKERKRKRTEGGSRGGNVAAEDEGAAKGGQRVQQKKPLGGDGSATKLAILGSLV